MNRADRLKYFYKQVTKPITLVAAVLGFVGVLLGAAGLFLAVRYSQLYKQAVDQQQVVVIEDDRTQQTDTSEEVQITKTEDKQHSYSFVYQVAAGDSLWKIAEQFYGDGCLYQQIATANNIANPNQLEIGTELVILSQEESTIGQKQQYEQKQTYSQLNQADSIVKSEVMADSASSDDRENSEHFTYYVEVGDSLWFIALKYYGSGYRWTEIYANNKTDIGANPNLIFPGTQLDL